MSISDLAIKRPIFISCIFMLILAVGALAIARLGVDLFPNVTFPIITVTVTYPGAGPREIETLVSKPIEDELSTLSGIKTLRSVNEEGVSTVIAEFTLDTDIKYAEQKTNDRVSKIRAKLPTEAKEPIVRTIDPADQPIVILALTADLPAAALYDLADQEVRSQLEQVKQVGNVEVAGGRKREIEVELDRVKLKARDLSASQIVNQIATAGKNLPAGKIHTLKDETLIRTLGEFESIKAIKSTMMRFYGNEVPIVLGDVAEVRDSLEDEKTRTYINGKQALTLMVFRQSGANTVAVVDAVVKRVARLNGDFKKSVKGFDLSVVRDGAKPIRANVEDVSETIIAGILLTVLVVFFFLGNVRSTLITGLALPNSLLGAFILMLAAGFTINIMTLLALSLAVGLLIDDAIVVRENIFRKIELGERPKDAASSGTKEVTLAVIATTLTVLAVFGPVAFLSGIVGQFFKEFGMTICFAMIISLFDALTMAPMLSAYFAGNLHAKATTTVGRFFEKMLGGFGKFQDGIEVIYIKILRWTLKHPLQIIAMALLIFFGSFGVVAFLPKTFLPTSDTGEFQVVLDLPAGTSLEAMDKLASEVDQKIRGHREVDRTVLTAGGRNGQPNEAGILVLLVPSKKRSMNTTRFKDIVRADLVPYSKANPKVQDLAIVGGSQALFNVNIIGNDLEELKQVSNALYEKLRKSHELKDVDISYRSGKPELQVVLDKKRGEEMGVSTFQMGQELRTHIEGVTPAVYRENGKEYDIRVRLREDQRNLREGFKNTYIPNLNDRLIRIADVARLVETEGPATIYRQDRGRYIQITADLNSQGKGMSEAIKEVKTAFESGEIKLPPGVHYEFIGQAQDFQDLAVSILIAGALAILLIYLVLSSLYESFATPLTIMLVLPLAACGAFYALGIMHSSLDLFSMIGCILLLGVATKNSILLVDYINQMKEQGKDNETSIIEAGKVRLRPILMTSFALIAGMLPVAIGLNEASRQRTSMGISVIGGLITSTMLTLVVIPAAYTYMERFRAFMLRIFGRFVTSG